MGSKDTLHCNFFFGNSYFRYSNIKTVLNRLKNNFKMLKLTLVAAVLVHVVASNVVDINVDVTVNGDKVPIAPEKTPPKGVEEEKHPADKGWPGPGCVNCCGAQCCSPLNCKPGCVCTCKKGGYFPLTLNRSNTKRQKDIHQEE